MKQLLEQLQQCPKTWERFEKFIGMKLYFFDDIGRGLELQHSHDCGFVITTNMYEFNGLLLDFCDKEGYYVVARPYYVYQANRCKWKYEITKFQLEEIEEFGNPSRQEAFNQGVIKAFELMEQKEK